MNDLEYRIRQRLNAIKKKYPEQKISQRWLAKQAGVSLNSVAKWLNGSTKDLKGEPLILASKALECDPAWLAGLTQENTGVPDYPTFGIVEDTVDLSAYVEFEMYDIELSAGNGNAAWIPRKDDTIMFRESWARKKGFKPSIHKGGLCQKAILWNRF